MAVNVRGDEERESFTSLVTMAERGVVRRIE